MKYSEIPHFHHPQHKLKFEYSESPFKCDGCKEVGIGSRYKCSSVCDYDLHVHCALPPSPVSSSTSFFHPFYTKCSFQFMSHPPGGTARYCNACEKDVKGFVYHCKKCGYDLHPCCAKLPMALDDGEIKLFLYRKVSSPCHRCGRKGRSWSYRSKCKSYNLHVACVREMLVENWQEVYVGRGKGMGMKNTMMLMQSGGSVHGGGGGRRSKGRVKKCCEIAALALQIVVSAVLGDPTALIAGIAGSMMSRA